MGMIKSIYLWLRRLPWRFSLGFFVFLIAWFIAFSSLLTFFELGSIAEAITKITFTESIAKTAFSGKMAYVLGLIPLFLEGLVIVVITFLGLLLSYNFAAKLNEKTRFEPTADVHKPAEPLSGNGTILQQFIKKNDIKELRIGIINAGGGAKGAYQAGALKAIHEFLEENDGLKHVKMIAGTSIGSWNSMFWLAGLIKPLKEGEMSAHEKWWKSINIRSLIDFSTYIPFRRNSFLNTAPWQETFLSIFKKHPDVHDYIVKKLYKDPTDALHFYLTRSNVVTGKLEFATNNTKLPKMERTKWKNGLPDGKEPIIPKDEYELIKNDEETDVFERMKLAVFASMDLPPLFPYKNIDGKFFEDGGVVDNLPMRFGTSIEHCNLLFVLPLNASFDAKANHKSVLQRLFRVMNIRQGVLERESMKITRLYNDKARLANPKNPSLVSVFSICPNEPLCIQTSELWKAAEAGQAFDLMYKATKKELNNNFLNLTDSGWLQMALVNEDGSVKYRDDF